MARLSCGVEITCIILFALNIFFLVFGFALLGFGIYLKVSKEFNVALSPHINAQIIGGEGIEIVGVILIIVGIFTVLLSAFGCLGALLRIRILLYLYAIILSLLMLLELAAFITVMSSRVRIRNSYQSGLWEVFRNAYNNHRPDLVEAVEELEREFHCCGVDGYKDYGKINRTLPLSCYEQQSLSEPVYGKGCADAFIDWMWDILPIVGGVVGATFIIEVFGVIASFSLAVAVSHYLDGQLDSTLLLESHA